jgi:tetratricopeptide (TPR) repeat protein/predicted Ser/Thr protein kinase
MTDTAPDEAPGQTPDPDQAPVRIGHHVLLHKLGDGGMGVVYAAYDERLDRRVAIKLLRRQGATRASVRLKREAQALARLSHPNVVQIYEIGEVNEQPFLVMELIDGVTLNRWRAGPRTRAEILTVFLAAGRGLAAAHEKGLIHRDFKPDNVMIRRDGQVVVMDFGLARGDERASLPTPEEFDSIAEPDELPTGHSSGGRVRSSELEQPLTMVGKVVGTVGYMAPEQVLGDSVHDRCDQFSFCVTLWEALYGERPFPGTQVQDFARAVMHDPPKSPEPNEVPVWLRKVLERGLARNPADRWPSMNELLDALQRDPTRSRRGWLIAVGLLALGIVGVAGVAVAEQRERDRADQQRAEQIAACEREGQAIAQDWNQEVATAIEQSFLATNSNFASSAWQNTRPWFEDFAREWSAVRTQICVETTVEVTRSEDSQALAVDCLDESRMYFVGVLEMLSHLGPNDTSKITTTTTTAARLHPPSVCTNEVLLQHRQLTPIDLRDELNDLRLRLERARARTFLGDDEGALREAQAVIVAANQLGWSPLIVRAGHTASSIQLRLAKYDDAKRSARQAFWAAAGNSDDLGMLQAATELVGALGHLGEFEEGHGWALLAKTLVEKLELTGTIYEARTLDRFSSILRGLGDDHEALRQQTRAVEIYEAVFGPHHPQVGAALTNLGYHLGDIGDHRAALDTLIRALEIFETTVGSEHPDVGAIYNNIGFELVHLGDFEGALEFQRRNLANSEAAFGSEHPYVALALANIGDLLCRRNECEEALQLQRRALEIYESEPEPDHQQVGTAHQQLANALDALGVHEEALEHRRRALSIFAAAYGPDHPLVQLARIYVGTSLRELGHIEQAIDEFRAALSRLEDDGDGLSNGLLQYGLALLDQGDVTAAREQLERALAVCERQDRVGVEPAGIRFALARVLWASGEQVRARELAARAMTGYRASGQWGALGLAEVEAWLREHPE